MEQRTVENAMFAGVAITSVLVVGAVAWTAGVAGLAAGAALGVETSVSLSSSSAAAAAAAAAITVSAGTFVLCKHENRDGDELGND